MSRWRTERRREDAALPDPLDVRSGAARVPWGHRSDRAPGIVPGMRSRWADLGWQDPGWVLPGGWRTTDRDLASRVAFNIDLLMQTYPHAERH